MRLDTVPASSAFEVVVDAAIQLIALAVFVWLASAILLPRCGVTP